MTKSRWTATIFREMSRKLKSPRAAAEEDKKRKDLHEYSDEALVDGEEEVHVAPSRKANKVSIGDVEDKKRKDLHE